MKKKKAKSTEPKKHPMHAEVEGILALVKNEAIKARKNIQSIDEKLQTIIDEADVTMPLVVNLNPVHLEGLGGLWTSVGQQVADLGKDVQFINLNINSTTGTSSASTATMSGYYVNDGFSNVETPEFKKAWSSFEAFAGRPSRREEVIQLFRDFGFDAPQVPGDQSPLEQFQTAHMIFEAPPVAEGNPTTASLLTLRECIDAVVTSLIRMRPHQERAQGHKNKIISIGNHLRKANFSQITVDELADEWPALYDDLSGLKKKEIGRTDWLAQLNRGTSFLFSLLTAVDINKLRR